MQPSKRRKAKHKTRNLYISIFVIQGRFDWVTDSRAEIQNFKNSKNFFIFKWDLQISTGICNYWVCEANP